MIMECTQAIDFTQPIFDTSLHGKDDVVAGWIEILGTRYELKQGCTKLGRDPETCKIVIENVKTISKEHVMFEVEDCHVTVCDLGSRNKSKLHNMYLKPEVRYALRREEKLTFGNMSAKFIKNENAEISDSDSDTLLSAINPDIDSPHKVLAPETPTYENESRRVVFESPIPESQDNFNNEKKGDIMSNPGIGIVCSVSKMPKISDEYNSDESTDIEDFLESYNVSDSPVKDSMPDENKKSLEEKDLNVQNRDDNTSGNINIFKHPHEEFSERSIRSGTSCNVEDVYNAPTQPVFLSGRNENQISVTSLKDSCSPELSINSSIENFGALMSPQKRLESGNEAEKLDQMEVSQSLLNDFTQFKDSTMLNTSHTNNHSPDSSEELFKLIKLEYNSPPVCTEEFKLPTPVKVASSAHKSKQTTVNSTLTIFDALTQVNIEKPDMKGDGVGTSQLTQLACEPVARGTLVEKNFDPDSTQDVLNVFNEAAHSFQADDISKHDINDDSTQCLLNAFRDERSNSRNDLNIKMINCPIKIRNDLVTSAAVNFELAIKPEFINTSLENTSIDDEGMFIMPTQVLRPEKAIVAKRAGSKLVFPPNITDDVFSMPTQCVICENTSVEFKEPSVLNRPKNTSATSSTVLETHEDECDAPTNSTFLKKNIDIYQASEINEYISTVQTQVIQSSENSERNAVSELETQIIPLGNIDVNPVVETSAHKLDAPTKIIPSKETVSPVSETTVGFDTTRQPLSGGNTEGIPANETSSDSATQPIQDNIPDIDMEPTQKFHKEKDDLFLAPTQQITATKQAAENITQKSLESSDDIYFEPTQYICKERLSVTPITGSNSNAITETLQKCNNLSGNSSVTVSNQTQSNLSNEDTDMEEFLEKGVGNHDEKLENEQILQKSSNNFSKIALEELCNIETPSSNMKSPKACISNSCFKDSCTTTEAIDEDNSRLDSTSLHTVTCTEANIVVGLPSYFEPIATDSVTETRSIMKHNEIEPTLKIMYGEITQDDVKAENIINPIVGQNDKDASGFHSSPLKISKTSAIKLKTFTVHKKSGNSHSERVLSSNIVEKMVAKHLNPAEDVSENVSDGNVKSAFVADNLIHHPANLRNKMSTDISQVRPTMKKKKPEELKHEDMPCTSNEPKPIVNEYKRTSRRSKPTTRYSPERFRETVIKDVKKLPIKKRPESRSIRTDLGTPFQDKMKNEIPAKTVYKRSSNKIEVLKTNKRFKVDTNDSSNTVVQQTRSTRQSSLRGAQNISIGISRIKKFADNVGKEVNEGTMIQQDVFLLNEKSNMEEDRTNLVSSNDITLEVKRKPLSFVKNKVDEGRIKSKDHSLQSDETKVKDSQARLVASNISTESKRKRCSLLKNTVDDDSMKSVDTSLPSDGNKVNGGQAKLEVGKDAKRETRSFVKNKGYEGMKKSEDGALLTDENKAKEDRAKLVGSADATIVSKRKCQTFLKNKVKGCSKKVQDFSLLTDESEMAEGQAKLVVGKNVIIKSKRKTRSFVTAVDKGSTKSEDCSLLTDENILNRDRAKLVINEAAPIESKRKTRSFLRNTLDESSVQSEDSSLLTDKSNLTEGRTKLVYSNDTIPYSKRKTRSCLRNKIDEVSVQSEGGSVLTDESNLAQDHTTLVDSNDTTANCKRKITSSVESAAPQVKSTTVWILEQQNRSRKSGRQKNYNTLSDKTKLQTIKEVFIDTSDKNELEATVATQESDSSLISETAKSKRVYKRINDLEEINSRLKRRRSSGSLSTESPPSCSGRRTSRRCAAQMTSEVGENAMQSLLWPKYNVMFTGYKDENDKEIVTRLGGRLVDSAKDCNVLVTTGLKRTCKLLAVLGGGSMIVSPDWLAASKKAGYFLDLKPFLVTDKNVEEKYGFALAISLSKAFSCPLFTGYSIHATKSVRPTPAELKEIVECAKGKYLKVAPNWFSEKLVIVSCLEDKRSWTALKKLKLPVVGIEFILTGLLRQEILIEENLLC